MKNTLLKKIIEIKNEGKIEEAIQLAESNKEKFNNNDLFELYLILGNLYDQLVARTKHDRVDLQKKSIDYFKKAKKYDSFKALRGIGTVYHHQGKPKKALKYYFSAHKENPKKADLSFLSIGNAYQRLGLMSKKNKYLKKAMKYYKKSLNVSNTTNNKLKALANLAVLSKNLDKKIRSIKYAKEALNILDDANKNYVSKSIKTAMEEIVNDIDIQA